uniref:Germin-like protein n=1 Tax=Chenopodium quinoa TaxID=63459 RepID=A0A803M1E6_CHEQI
MAAILCIVVFLLAPLLSHAADPDPLLDFCVADLNASPSFTNFPCKPTSNVTSEDFFFDGFMKEGNTSNLFGVGVTQGNVLAFPALNMLGLSMNRVDLAPNGLNPPHSHPRATESGVVINGKILVGFVTTGNVFYSKVLLPGQMFVIPRGPPVSATNLLAACSKIVPLGSMRISTPKLEHSNRPEQKKSHKLAKFSFLASSFSPTVLILIKGKVLAGFVTTGNVFYSKVLLPGQMFVIPRGSFSEECGRRAAIKTAFNSKNPGAVIIPTNLFGSQPSIPDHVLTQTVDSSVVHEMKIQF